ncbi:MAG TPA: uroporphyrinogen decarboxylase family protein [Clostridia bacterium]|nr:uroporphyrinogen decarboxylase family protein [Clostridia bacterium]
MIRPLTRQEMCDVIDGKGAAYRTPSLLQFWTRYESWGGRQEACRAIMRKYPCDAQIVRLCMPVHTPHRDDPSYRLASFLEGNAQAIDAKVHLPDWSRLDEMLESFPDPQSPTMLRWYYPSQPPEIRIPPEPDGRYRLAHFWNSYFERLWGMRGMTRALMDFYDYPDQVHRFFDRLTQFYCAAAERAAELGCDGLLTSDDLGTQRSLFLAPAVFEEFLAPYYKRLIDCVHSHGMHFWLHTCGCVTPILPRLVELGMDVIHPIQKYAMDQMAAAKEFAGKFTVWIGFDVQQTIPYGTADEVHDEARALIRAWQRPEGKMIFAAGNGINGDCPLESLEALYAAVFEGAEA